MKIPCPACAAKYSVADDKIQSRLAKIRCRKCGVTIVIDGTVDPVNVYVGEGGQKSSGGASLPGPSNPARADGSLGLEASPESGAPDSTGPAPNEYAVDIADNDQRNMSLDRIVSAYNSGVITAETYIWKEGMTDWQMLGEVPEVYNALHAAARASGLPQASSFGRQSPDLFGAGGGLQGDLNDQQMVAGTGARNESSVLFSLSALTSGNVQSPLAGSSDRKAAKPRTEDSGLIDLQALTAAAESPAPYASAGQVSAFGGPALISAPLGGVTSSTMNGPFSGYSKRSSSKTGFIIGGAILVAAGIGAVLFMMQGGETSSPAGSVAVGEEKSPSAQADDPPRKAGTQAEQGETAAATPDPEPEEAVAPPPKKQPAAAAPAADPDETSPVRKVTHSQAPAPRKTTPASLPAPRPTAKAAPEPVAETPKPAPAAPAAPAAADRKKKACDCKPADLMCAMRCSAAK